MTVQARYSEAAALQRLHDLGLAPLLEGWLDAEQPTLRYADVGVQHIGDVLALLDLHRLDYLAVWLDTLPVVHVITGERFPPGILAHTPATCIGSCTPREACDNVMRLVLFDGLARVSLSEGWAPSVVERGRWGQAGGVGGLFLDTPSVGTAP